MIEVYGQPATFKSVRTNTSLTWRSCMKLCLDTIECVVAYNKTGCRWYAYNNITAVNQTTAKEGQVVAFKVANTESTCPTGTNPPTFNNKDSVTSIKFQVVAGTNPINVNYTIKFAKGVWKISYTTKDSCPSKNFTLFQRSTIDWCFRMFISTESTNYDTAVAKCKEDNTVLTGPMNANEAAWLAYSASYMKPLIPRQSDYLLRIDGIRTSACQSTPTSTTCKTAKGFTFNDKNIDSISGYTWATNAGAKATGDSNCLVMVVNGNNAVKTDVRSCSASTTPLAYAFMCGRQAWVW